MPRCVPSLKAPRLASSGHALRLPRTGSTSSPPRTATTTRATTGAGRMSGAHRQRAPRRCRRAPGPVHGEIERRARHREVRRHLGANLATDQRDLSAFARRIADEVSARRRASVSSAPPTGTPKCWWPHRPSSWIVVCRPARTTTTRGRSRRHRLTCDEPHACPRGEACWRRRVNVEPRPVVVADDVPATRAFQDRYGVLPAIATTPQARADGPWLAEAGQLRWRSRGTGNPGRKPTKKTTYSGSVASADFVGVRPHALPRPAGTGPKGAAITHRAATKARGHAFG